ncbi:MAG: ABC transporter ATP-binding protein [Nonlabens sp.]
MSVANEVILKVEKLSKQYRLGLIGTGTLSHDLNRWWHLLRGKEDPYLTIGEVNDRSKQSTGDYVWAIKDVDFEVKRGEVLGIIGKNGAGKSTLLKLLSRVSSPTTGSIKTRGRIASLLEVGTGFHPELTGKENIFLNGAILGMNKNEISEKIDEIVEFSGCQMYIDTPVKRYSSGMRVRLAFAVAAHLEPDILIVDEVLAVGDAEFQKKAIGKMQDISSGQGRTVLFVSHDMAAIRSLCTRLLVLSNGMVSFEGTVEEGLGHYLLGAKQEVINLRFGPNYIKSIEVRDSDNFKIGQDLRLKINLDLTQSLSDLIVLINIKNSLGAVVCEFHSKGSNNSLNMTIGDQILELVVNDLNLHFGVYDLDLVLYDGSKRHEYENIASINCMQSDVPINKFHLRNNNFYFDYNFNLT